MEFYKENNKIVDLIMLFLITTAITVLIKRYFQPFFIVVFITIVTQPIYKIIFKVTSSKSISAILSLIIVNSIIFLIIFYFGNTLLMTFQKLYRDNSLEVMALIENLKLFLNLDFDKIMQSLSSFFSGSIIMKGAILTGDGIISYFLADITTYFILVDKEKIKILIMNIFKSGVIKNINEKNRNLRDVFKIEIILIIISSIIIVVGFKVLGVANPIFLGTLCAVLDILPFVGTIIVFIPIIIYNIIIKRYLLVIGLIALYLLERFTREILEAKFLSNKLQIHPITVMLSIYIGVKMFGFIGIIAGPIYSMIAKDIIYKT